MNLLALESSAAVLTVALFTGERLVERQGAAGTSHSDLVLPLIQTLLDEAGLDRARLDAVAFGAGPGAFTGLRLACAVAQGLAFARGLPVIGVGSLEALALNAGRERVYACVDARMNEVYCAAYEVSGGEVRTVLQPVVCPPEQAPLPPEGDWCGGGDGFAAYQETLSRRLGAALTEVQPAAMASAAAVARLAAPRLARGEGVDAALAAPIYVRDKVALTTAERLARGGKA